MDANALALDKRDKGARARGKAVGDLQGFEVGAANGAKLPKGATPAEGRATALVALLPLCPVAGSARRRGLWGSGHGVTPLLPLRGPLDLPHSGLRRCW